MKNEKKSLKKAFIYCIIEKLASQHQKNNFHFVTAIF